MHMYVDRVGSVRWLLRRSSSVLAVAAMLTAYGMVAALGAYASSHHRHSHRLGVFSHPLTRRGHAKNANTRNLPAGSALAEIFGTDEIYVSEEAGMLCIWDIETTSEGTPVAELLKS